MSYLEMIALLYTLGMVLWVVHYVQDNSIDFYNKYYNSLYNIDPGFKLGKFIKVVSTGIVISPAWFLYYNDFMN